MIMRYFILCLLFLSFFSGNVYAQSRPSIVIEHITDHGSSMGSEPKPGSEVKLINTPRNPRIGDVIDAMKKGKKVTVVLSMGNAGNRWAHAVRVVAINLTSYDGTNADNETVGYNDAEIYDPTTNETYNLTFSYIYNKNDTGYLQWGAEWVPLSDVITMYPTKTIVNPGRSSGFKYGFSTILTLTEFRKNFLLNYKL